MTKRYLGNIITQNPTAPAGPYEDGAASGVWSLAEALSYTKGGLWPIAGNFVPTPAFFSGGNSFLNTIQTIQVSSTGNATDFGDLTYSANGPASCGSSTHAFVAGGQGAGNAYFNTINTFSTSSGGEDASDFGDLTQGRYELSGLSNNTRGVFAAGWYYSGGFIYTNIMDYITLSTSGNAVDFGDVVTGNGSGLAACSSTTRGIYAGNSEANKNVIQYITIASTGNATDFGDLLQDTFRMGGCSSPTRGMFGGGQITGGRTNEIQYVTISSLGNSVDFGDLTVARNSNASASSHSRAVWAGGDAGAGNTNTIDYVEISTTGNAIDFGDLATATSSFSGCSSSHGGIAA
jgi:hypothetical protein|tara:strand:+ start:2745 stop:3788 length:1044 start_codon:yes stop_codon:yes gene_type:complete